MSKETKVATEYPEEAWESGALGRSLEHAEVIDDEFEKVIDAAFQLQPISIRLEKRTIDAFKFIASQNKNIGYQTLMRQVLHRFVDGELIRIGREIAARQRAAAKHADTTKDSSQEELANSDKVA